MASTSKERIKEFMERAEFMLSLYLSSAGGSQKSEPWYTIMAMGIDALFSLSIAAAGAAPLQDAALDTARADLLEFFTLLLGERSYGEKSYLNVIGLTNK